MLYDYYWILPTPIIVAEYGYIRALNILIERGDDINYLDFNGCSPYLSPFVTMILLLRDYYSNMTES